MIVAISATSRKSSLEYQTRPRRKSRKFIALVAEGSNHLSSPAKGMQELCQASRYCPGGYACDIRANNFQSSQTP
jgi:hypothetical protein